MYGAMNALTPVSFLSGGDGAPKKRVNNVCVCVLHMADTDDWQEPPGTHCAIILVGVTICHMTGADVGGTTSTPAFLRDAFGPRSQRLEDELLQKFGMLRAISDATDDGLWESFICCHTWYASRQDVLDRFNELDGQDRIEYVGVTITERVLTVLASPDSILDDEHANRPMFPRESVGREWLKCLR